MPMTDPRPRSRPRLTVVVGTRRRPAELVQAVTTLEDVWDDLADELVVVDVAPTTDDAERLLGTTRLAARRLVVPDGGPPAWRNAGWRAATGGVVVFYDDDIRPHPGAIAAVRSAFLASPDLDALGGPIELRWPGVRPPRWYTTSLASHYSAIDAVNGSLTYPAVANLAIRRSTLDQLGGFDESLPAAEGLELLTRLEAAGGRIEWSHEAAVTHVVSPDAVRLGWLAGRAFASGRADILLERARPGGHPERTAAAAAVATVTKGWDELRRARARDELAPQLAVDLSRRARRLGRVVEAVTGRT